MNCIIKAWNQHEAELRGYLTRRLGDPRQAEDLLQDTFVKALGLGSAFCTLNNARAWLFQVARNQLIDHLRRQRPTVALDTNIAEQEPAIAAVETLAACLPRALSALDEQDREVISACDLEGMSQLDYARQQGIGLPGAKSRVQRARRRLRKQLQTACRVRFDDDGRVCCFVPAKPGADAGNDPDPGADPADSKAC